jgi:transcriptional regulator of aromatic amino acid metabolism
MTEQNNENASKQIHKSQNESVSKQIYKSQNAIQIEVLDAQILNLRKLHSESLQMLLVLGKNLLSTQKDLLTTARHMQAEYEKFSTFMTANTAHLPDPAVESDTDG